MKNFKAHEGLELKERALDYQKKEVKDFMTRARDLITFRKDCLKTVVDSAYHNHPASQHTAEQYMSNVMRSVKPGMSIVDAANIFLSTPFKRLLVLDDRDTLVGQISRRDVLKAIQD